MGGYIGFRSSSGLLGSFGVFVEVSVVFRLVFLSSFIGDGVGVLFDGFI